MSKTKVYLEIVHQIRQMITNDGLRPGDRLPSERELSERLNAGRSSVREGLRAIELLGLIETRRGEGTYLRDFKDHHLVDLLSTFILEDDKVRNDVLTTKSLIEKDAIRLIIKNNDIDSILLLKVKLELGEISFKEDFFYHLLNISNNRLLLKIWLIIKEFASQLCEPEEIIDYHTYLILTDAILADKLESALHIYDHL